MNRIARMPVAERHLMFTEVAERLHIQPVIVEKDFWVCWLLERLLGRRRFSGRKFFALAEKAC